MKLLKKFLQWYLYITTGILIVTCICFAIDGVESLPKETLWQILLSGFLTTLVTLLFAIEDCIGWKKFIIKGVFHYLSLSAVMIVCGKWFGWLKLNAAGIIMMLIAVAVVYFIAFWTYYIVDMRQAEIINQRLKEKYGKEE